MPPARQRKGHRPGPHLPARWALGPRGHLLLRELRQAAHVRVRRRAAAAGAARRLRARAARVGAVVEAEPAGALLGLGEGAGPHPDATRLCAEKDKTRSWLPL